MAFAATLAASATFALVPLQTALVSLPFVVVLSVLSAIDIRSHLLPDTLTLPLLLSGLLVSTLGFGPPILSSATGAALGWGSFAAIAYVYRVIRGFDGLGLGDAKLLGAIGAWCGVLVLPMVVFAASAFALLFYIAARIKKKSADRYGEIPFGPFLALAGWFCMILTRTELDMLSVL